MSDEKDFLSVRKELREKFANKELSSLMEEVLTGPVLVGYARPKPVPTIENKKLEILDEI